MGNVGNNQGTEVVEYCRKCGEAYVIREGEPPPLSWRGVCWKCQREAIRNARRNSRKKQ